MIIPIEELSADALNGIIESYILREGTDYGAFECSLNDKKQQLKAQLTSGEIVLVYSELHETVTLLPAEKFSSAE